VPLYQPSRARLPRIPFEREMATTRLAYHSTVRRTSSPVPVGPLPRTIGDIRSDVWHLRTHLEERRQAPEPSLGLPLGEGEFQNFHSVPSSQRQPSHLHHTTQHTTPPFQTSVACFFSNTQFRTSTTYFRNYTVGLLLCWVAFRFSLCLGFARS